MVEKTALLQIDFEHTALEKIQTVVKAGASVNVVSNDGRPLLFLAVQANNEKAVDFLIKQGASVFSTDRQQKTALMYAAEYGFDKIVARLLKAGANVNAVDADSNTALYLACKKGFVDVVKLLVQAKVDLSTSIAKLVRGEIIGIKTLISAGVSVNYIDRWKKSLLMNVILYNSHPSEMIKFLIQSGEDINVRDTDGETVLMKAIKRRQEDVIRTIYQYHPYNIDLTDKNGESIIIDLLKQNDVVSLHLLFELGVDINNILSQTASDPEASKQLIGMGAKVNQAMILASLRKDEKAVSDLIHLGADYRHILLDALEYNDFDLAKMILNSDVDVDQIVVSFLEEKNTKALIALFKLKMMPKDFVFDLIQGCQLQMLDKLSELGANLDIVDSSGKTTLVAAVEAGDFDMAEFLLSKKPNLSTSIFWAARNNPQILKTMIERLHIDINAFDSTGKTVLMQAVSFSENPDLIQLLINMGASVSLNTRLGVNALMYAAEFNRNPQVLKVLLACGGDLTQKDHGGKTALDYAAAFNGNVEVLKYLMLSCSKVFYTNSLLMYAAGFNDNPEVVKFLIDRHFDVNRTGAGQTTALMYATGFNESPEVVELLLNAGANVKAVDQAGNSALMYAAKNNFNLKIFDLLIQAGAVVDANVLFCAKKYNPSKEVYAYLEKKTTGAVQSEKVRTDLKSKFSSYLKEF
ncbi:MAG: ankyrin repeat domain-containing protein [Alphaproteobacteria bacterium]|nr:ankyrin repeat domain-containing protein [Alphaproteobacteria bacterium]